MVSDVGDDFPFEFDRKSAVRRGAPPVPDEAPPELKNRYRAMIDAIAVGHCPECLVYVEQTTVAAEPPAEPGFVAMFNMTHLPACPLHPGNIAALASQLGYSWSVPVSTNEPPIDLTGDDISKVIEDLGIEDE